MLCQQCKQHPATTHIKRTVNGKTTEAHLCAACAKEQGLSPLFGGLSMDMNTFWGNLFSEPSARELRSTVACEGCGSTFAQIAESGKVGCPQCYTTFYDRLKPTIERIHGKAAHVGKRPSDPVSAETSEKQTVTPPTKEEQKKALQEELDACIVAQEYERCAALRDQIRALETGEEDAT